MPKDICPAEDGWGATFEGDTALLACPAGQVGTIARLCALGATWTEPVANCSRLGGAA